VSEARAERSSALAYLEATPAGDAHPSPLLCLHGFPETSFMWRGLLDAASDAGFRGLAPDMPGSGRSPADPPNTWERLVEAVEAFVAELDLPPVVLVVHDWGALIGLRWACEHPDRVAALVIADSGFFPDGKWHGMAAGLRTHGTGEEMLGAMDRESFGGLMATVSPGMTDEAVDEYWLSLGTEEGRSAILEMYRSGDFEKLAPYDGALGRLGVPTLIVWGANDEFAPVAGAHRFHNEIPGSELKVFPGAGHFLFSDAPADSVAAVVGFLGGLPPAD
jgi:haloalkane dehalogenase